jgi:NADPH:quinone reductase-like Zn-dependent oxidoreductase
MDAIPSAVYLTAYTSELDPYKTGHVPFRSLIKQIEAGKLSIQIGKVFHIDDIVEAHKTMDENLACGKIVVLTE